MDFMSLIGGIPGIGPAMPWIALVLGINTYLIVPSLPTPATADSAYAFIFNILNKLAGNYGNAKSPTPPVQEPKP